MSERKLAALTAYGEKKKSALYYQFKNRKTYHFLLLPDNKNKLELLRRKFHCRCMSICCNWQVTTPLCDTA